MAATHITSTNVSGPPGTGVAWTNNVRGIKWSGLMLLQGIGPWGIPNAVTDRAWISVSSAADQFSACLANLTQIIRDCGVDAPWVDPEAENVLNQCKIIWLHLNDIGDFQAIATRWGERFGTVDFHTHEWRTLQPGEDGPIMGGRYVHPIVGGAKVEIDVLLGDLDYRLAHKNTDLTHLIAQLQRGATGWTSVDGSEEIVVIGEEDHENQEEWDIEGTKPIGILQWTHWWDSGGKWLGRVRYGLDYPAETVYAHQRRSTVARGGVVICHVSGFDVDGQLTGFSVVDRYPDESVVAGVSTLAYGLYAQFRPPPTFSGLAWFDYTVTGPSGVSRPQRYLIEVTNP